MGLECAHYVKFRCDSERQGPHAMSRQFKTLAEIERNYILQVLKRLDSNRMRAARVLGVSIRGLRNKLRDYKRLGIDVPEASHHSKTKNR
jgi:DNA-binding NtrC family response regulator